MVAIQLGQVDLNAKVRTESLRKEPIECIYLVELKGPGASHNTGLFHRMCCACPVSVWLFDSIS